MDEDSGCPLLTPAPVSGFVSGHETTFNWSDGDVIVSDAEERSSASGW